MRTINIHIPLLARIWVAVFGTGWCGFFVVSATVRGFRGADAGGIAMAIVMSAFGATLCYRIFRLAVTTDGDELVVRNYWRTRRIPRGQIRGFGDGRPSFGRGRSVITVETTTGSVPLDVFTTLPSATDRLLKLNPTHLRREPALEALLAWSARSPLSETLHPWHPKR